MNQEQLQKLIEEVEASGMLKAPVDLKRAVLEKSRRPDIQLMIRTQEFSRGRQLFFYSLKIGMAAVMALYFLFCMPNDFSMPDLNPPTEAAMESYTKQETLAEKVDKTAAAVSKHIAQLANEWIKKED